MRSATRFWASSARCSACFASAGLIGCGSLTGRTRGEEDLRPGLSRPQMPLFLRVPSAECYAVVASASASMRARVASSRAYSASSIAAAAKSIASCASLSASSASRSASLRSNAAFLSSMRWRRRWTWASQSSWTSGQPLWRVARPPRPWPAARPTACRRSSRRVDRRLQVGLVLHLGGLDVGVGRIDLVRELPEAVRQRHAVLPFGSDREQGEPTVDRQRGLEREGTRAIRLGIGTGAARAKARPHVLSPSITHAQRRPLARRYRSRPRPRLPDLARGNHRHRARTVRDLLLRRRRVRADAALQLRRPAGDASSRCSGRSSTSRPRSS